MSKIHPISSGDASRLCSGQVITTLVDAVKELLDNSLDSGAGSVEIRLLQNGLESIEVIDDGHGIPETDLDMVCEKYATSKISSFEDLNNVESFGFRGEALSSLASLSTCVRIHTKEEGAEIGFKVEYNRQGSVVKKTKFPRTKGTTVKVVDLFSAIPVRRKHMQDKIKHQVAKLVSVVKGYTFSNIHLKLLIVNQVGKEKKEVLHVTPATDLKQRVQGIISHEPIFSEITKSVIFKEVAEEFGIVANQENIKDEESIDFAGVISNPKRGKSSNEWQFLSINSRPVDYPKLSKIVNQVFRSFDPTGTGNQYPVLILNMKIPAEKVDVNVTPDKRTVFVSNEKVLFALVKSSVLKIFSSNVSSFEQTKYCQSSSQVTVISSDDSDVAVENSIVVNVDPRDEAKSRSSSVSSRRITEFYEPIEIPVGDKEMAPLQCVSDSQVRNEFKTSSAILSERGFEVPFHGSSSRPKSAASANQFLSKTSLTGLGENRRSYRRSLTPEKFDASTERDVCKRKRRFSSSPSSRSGNTLAFGECTSSFRPPRPTSPVALVRCGPSTMTSGELEAKSTKTVIDDKPGPVPVRRRVTCSYDFGELLYVTNSSQSIQNESHPKFTPNLSQEDEEAAIDLLSREMNKFQFKEMRVVGQFNKGFIITQIGSTLFVVDQHASDERRNFDELLESTQLDSQSLIQPIPLALTAYEEYLISNNLDIFTRNGFKLACDAERDLGKRYSITAVPSSGDRIFGVEQIEEILEAIKDSAVAAKSMRPTKVKDMLAMKACRKSIMIGDTLTRQDMVKVIDRMSETSHPWTCAHGRPTIRCLGSLNSFRKYYT